MFEITSLAKARLDDVVVLSQKNRKPDEDPGAKLSIELDMAGDTLTLFDRRWPDILWEPDPEAKQGALDGMATDRLTNIGSKVGTIHWTHELTGYQLTIDRGTGGKSNIIVADCVLDNIRLTPKEGRSCKVKFSLDSSDVSETDFGRLAKMKSCEISILLSKPVIAQTDIEDETTPAKPRKPGPAERAAVDKVKGVDNVSPFPKQGSAANTEPPPQSVTVEQSQPGTRTARGREATAKFIEANTPAA